jgi:hypothetical protein
MRLAWFLIGVGIFIPLSVAFPVEPPASSPSGRYLDVRVEPTGGVHATAAVVFPVEPAIIQRILTDYAHWPDLFDVRMRMAEVREQAGRTVTDIRIAHALLLGERRLVCESRSLPEGGLVTDLREGDFKQYRRVWRLRSVEDGRHTKAEFDLLVEIDTIVPDWLIAATMRRDLEAHFRLLTEKALAQSRSGK